MGRVLLALNEDGAAGSPDGGGKECCRVVMVVDVFLAFCLWHFVTLFSTATKYFCKKYIFDIHAYYAQKNDVGKNSVYLFHLTTRLEFFLRMCGRNKISYLEFRLPRNGVANLHSLN